MQAMRYVIFLYFWLQVREDIMKNFLSNKRIYYPINKSQGIILGLVTSEG